MRVFIASPYRDSDPAQVELNLQLAKAACRKAALAGHAPFAPHLFYTQFLDDAITVEREAGIRSGTEFLAICDELWICGEITEGVALEVAEARRLGISVIDKTGF